MLYFCNICYKKVVCGKCGKEITLTSAMAEHAEEHKEEPLLCTDCADATPSPEQPYSS